MFFSFFCNKGRSSEENNDINSNKTSFMVLDVFGINVDGVENTVIVGIPAHGSISLNDTLRYQDATGEVDLKVVKLEQPGVKELTTIDEFEQVAIWVDKCMGSRIARGKEMVKVA